MNISVVFGPLQRRHRAQPACCIIGWMKLTFQQETVDLLDISLYLFGRLFTPHVVREMAREDYLGQIFN